MAYYPQNATGLNYITLPAGPVTGSATVVTANGSNNVKGSYAQITASSGFTCNALILGFYGGSSNAGENYLFDLATGAAASEVVLIANIAFSTEGVADATAKWTRQFPAAIASGTRISARVQCSVGGRNMRAALSLVAAGGVAGIATWNTYGSNTSTSLPTLVDPGAVANTKGSYVQMTASSSAVTQWIGVDTTNGGNAGPNGASWYLDLATGAAASEVVLIPDIGAYIGDFILNTKLQYWLTYIAAGTRIACRSSCDNTASPDRLIYVSLIAGTAPAESSGGGGAWAYC